MKNKKFYQKSGATMQTVAPQPISLKRRIACFVLLGLFVFWTIGSVIAVYLGASSSKDSAMITADAAPPVSSGASNQLAFEFELVGLSYSTFDAYSDNQQMFFSAMNYKVNFYFDYDVMALNFYSYASQNPPSNLYLEGPVLWLRQPFTSNGTPLIVENFDREEKFFVKYDSGSARPALNEIPVQVTYESSRRIYDTLTYYGYTIHLLFLSPNGSLRRYDMFFGVYGSDFQCPLAGTNSTFYDIPMSPLTYKQFYDYDLTLPELDELTQENLQLQSEILLLNNQITNLQSAYFTSQDQNDSLRAELTLLQNDYYSLLTDIDETYTRGYTEGRTQGYSEGYNVGYDVGFPAGVADANDYSFVGLISAVVDVPVRAFVSLFNFDLLGFNLANFFFGVITLVIIIKLLKWFL